MADANPFAALSLIAAPAVLTNAASLLTMSTSNRLGRAVDRARDLARQLEALPASGADDRRLRELLAADERGVLLMRALRSFYSAIGGFACATLLSLIGAVVSSGAGGLLVQTLEIVAVAAGTLAVGALVHGSALLLRETSVAVTVMRERTATIRSSLP